MDGVREAFQVFLFYRSFIKVSEHNANTVNPDQTPRSAASVRVFVVCQCPFYGTLGLYGLLVLRILL